ncbi:MAG: ATP-dependent DNA ligase [Acidimicrobiales bacterium]|nr:ATP-dependent DNA ligase [Acidimicrobiales bacterium]
MDLPVSPPVKPMLAKAVDTIPAGEPGTLQFEPKWDGFRCIVFRDGDDVELGSRNERSLTRYFPELLEPLRRSLPARCVVDGELVVASSRGLDFDALQQRIHPADSRIQRLARETPASFVAFDLLALDDGSLLEVPLRDRRAELEAALDAAAPPVHLTPVTLDRSVAEDWFVRFEGAGLDGVVAKPLDAPYEPDRRAQFKIKHRRTADCVVAGYRLHKDGSGPGSLLLGLYDGDGVLHHIGVATSFSAALRRRLRDELAPYEADALRGHPWREWADAQAHAGAQRLPGAVSRWNATKDLSFVAVRPELVAEVTYEQLQHGRLRHGARFARWRPDRRPDSCTYAQLDEVPPLELAELFGA